MYSRLGKRKNHLKGVNKKPFKAGVRSGRNHRCQLNAPKEKQFNLGSYSMSEFDASKSTKAALSTVVSVSTLISPFCWASPMRVAIHGFSRMRCLPPYCTGCPRPLRSGYAAERNRCKLPSVARPDHARPPVCDCAVIEVDGLQPSLPTGRSAAGASVVK